MFHSTCVALNGQLLAVSGAPLVTSTKNVYLYNTETNSWEVNCQMFTSRQLCLVTVLPGNKLMVAGGRKVSDVEHHDVSKVEIATVQ